jgi:phage/plasmid primase-like uncharacterized protein
MIKLKDILFESYQPVRDRKGKLIGMLFVMQDGRIIFRSSGGKMLGTYYPKTNETRDHNGTLVGRGNLLTSLITIYK